MSSNRLIGLVIAAIVVVALILFGVYHYKTPATEPKPQAEQTAPAPEAPKSEGEQAPGTEAQPSKTVGRVPAFDIVRIEKTGEGVIAGQAAPGWAIRLESNGSVVAETTADDEGAWSVVLDKPLSPGDHTLILKAVSPDGTNSLTAQQPVKVAVGDGAEATAKPDQASSEETAPSETAADTESAEKAPAKPRPVRFEDVQYEEAGPDSGKLKIAGTGDAGASILLFLDDQALGQVTIGPDGTWSFEADTKLDRADHALRVDLIEAGTGVVIGRTAAAFRRRPDTVSASQPQPVYPDGPPEIALPRPSTAIVAAEPPSTANQPQPVYPNGPPEQPGASASVAEGVPSLETQPQPVYPDGAPDGGATSEAEVAASEPAGRAQPQPVYPEGSPAAAAAPTYPVAAAEPPSTDRQPQPVHEPAPADSSPAATADSGLPSVEAQPQPVSPADEQPSEAFEQPAVTAETPGDTPRVHAEPMVVFGSVDYRESDAGAGKVGLSGTGDPGARIRLFLDNGLLGETTVGEDGRWSFESETNLAAGEHTFRADRVDPDSGAVVGRASLGMERIEQPAPKEEAVAAAEPAPSEPAAEPEAPSGEDAAAQAEQPAPAAKKTKSRPRVYTVRRGDTLWDIAEYYYGGGWRYRAIVRENRRKIKDPHWIYPLQQFSMPQRR